MRIRTIKPEFWISESVGRLSRDARLLFIGLWSFSDDSGRGRGAFAAISGALFSYDEDAHKKVPVWFAELEQQGMVRRYLGDDGNAYFDIPKWLKHQRIEKPTPSKIQPFTESSPNPRRILTESSPLDQGSGIRDQGVERGMDRTPAHTRDPKPKTKKTILPAEWKPNETHRKIAVELGVDLGTQVAAFVDYEAGHVRRMADWDATFRTWLRKSAEFSARVPKKKLLPQEETQQMLTEWLNEQEGIENESNNFGLLPPNNR